MRSLFQHDWVLAGMNDATPFFQEVRRSLMVRGDGWKSVLAELPSHINVSETKELLQTRDQLTRLEGYAHIAGGLVQVRLSDAAVLPYMDDKNLTLQDITLQWLYRFILVESFCEHNRRDPLVKWNPMFLHMVEQGLHFLLYMAALLVLYEEKKIYACLLKESLHEDLVKARITQACEFLHPKAQDYGESFRRHGLIGLLPRLWDKIARYAQLKADNRLGNFEKLEDSARDLLGYCCIAYSLMLELPEEVRQGFQPTAVYETESNVMAGAAWKRSK